MPDISSLNNTQFNELDSSLLLTVGNGLTQTGSTYVASPNSIGLATYDNWLGTIDSGPQPTDIVSYNLTVADASLDVVQYTFTQADGDVNPATGGIGALVVGWNSTGVLLEQLTGYVPGQTQLQPDGQFLIVENPSVDLATFDAAGNPMPEQATTAELTFNTTGPFPTFPPVCFAAGTRIRTERGEIAVEDLVEGDRVCVQDAGAETTRPVIWIGHRDVRLAGCANPFEVQPIRIRADAFADGMPHRDLLVSPCHAVFVDGRLIPAGLLVNHTSIVRETRLPKVRYFHVELDRHAILFAEGLPAESYLDTGNRAFFQNSAIVDINVGRAGMQPSIMREMLSCAPFADAPEVVLPVWDRLAVRAWHLGYGVAKIETTTDPSPRLAMNGSEFGPVAVRGNKYSFILPPGQQEVRLLSRAARPCEARPWVSDERVLGLSVSRIVIRDGADVMDLALDGPAAARGWWALEGNGLHMSRWTNGDASLRLPGASSLRLLEFAIDDGMVYPLSGGWMPEVIAAAA